MEQSNIYLLMLVLGQIAPPITDLINKHVPSAKIRFVASWIVPTVIAATANFEQLRFGNVEEFAVSLLVISASSQTAYKMYYEGSTWQNNIRYTADSVPLKALIPPVSLLAPKLQSLKAKLQP